MRRVKLRSQGADGLARAYCRLARELLSSSGIKQRGAVVSRSHIDMCSLSLLPHWYEATSPANHGGVRPRKTFEEGTAAFRSEN